MPMQSLSRNPQLVMQTETTDKSHGSHAESETKRRKIRKGTRSCWECKKRKMKCVFADSASPIDAEAICIGCQRRETKCVSQEFEFVEGRESPRSIERRGRRRIGSQDRVAKVEALVEQLIKKVGRDGSPNGEAPATSETPAPQHGIPTPTSIDLNPSGFLSLYKSSDVRICSEATSAMIITYL